ncbi:hypothetical protein BH24PSE2_BH24PSE2_19040 [soil metagenome]
MRFLIYTIGVMLLAACTAQEPADDTLPLASHGDYAQTLRASGLAATLLGRDWLDAAEQSLQSPVAVELPYFEQGAFLAHRPRAEGFAFEAVAGQPLVVTVEFPAGARLFADVFAQAPDTAASRSRKVGSLAPDMSELRVEIPATGRYLLRLQPELLSASAYELKVEIEAAYPFPVREHDITAVRSFFGDPRDGGSRRHEGVDIFAPRGTPVLAVADGRATSRRSRLGGNTVWLRGRGAAYYYAHLDEVAVSAWERVEAGDVLGYVGNTGNARMTAPHLHFGVYRRRHGAIDPLPLLRAWQLEEQIAGAEFQPHDARITASLLNVRAAPGEHATVLQTIERDTLVRVRAIAGTWSRVTLADGGQGWIASRFREPVAEPLYTRAIGSPARLRELPSPSGTVIAELDPDASVEILAESDRYLFARLPALRLEGWLPREVVR